MQEQQQQQQQQQHEQEQEQKEEAEEEEEEEKEEKEKEKENERAQKCDKKMCGKMVTSCGVKEHHTVLCTCAHVQSTWTTLFHFCPYPSLRFYDHNSGDQAMTSAGTARWFWKRKWNRDCNITIQNQTPITLASGGLDTWFRKGNCKGIIEWPQALKIRITQHQAKQGDMIGQEEFSATVRPPALSNHGK